MPRHFCVGLDIGAFLFNTSRVTLEEDAPDVDTENGFHALARWRLGAGVDCGEPSVSDTYIGDTERAGDPADAFRDGRFVGRTSSSLSASRSGLRLLLDAVTSPLAAVNSRLA